MPEVLKKFLESLNDNDAKEIWNYLDGWPCVAQDIIEIVVDAHPEIRALAGV